MKSLVSVILSVAMAIFLTVSIVIAADVEVGLGLGQGHTNERGDRLGNKTMAVERLKLSGGDKYYGSVSLEYWKTISQDQNFYGPDNMGAVAAKAGYWLVKEKDFDLIPTIGVSFEKIDRRANPKFPTSASWGYPSWSWQESSHALFGGIFRYKWAYLEINLNVPIFFYTDTKNYFPKSWNKIQEPHEDIVLGFRLNDLLKNVFSLKVDQPLALELLRRQIANDPMESMEFFHAVILTYKFYKF